MGQFKYRLTIQAGLCLIGCLQLVAFTSLLFQFPYLYGRHGVQPISTLLEGAQAGAAQQRWKLTGTAALSFPSLLWLHSSLGLTAEALLAVLCSIGWLLSAAAACSVVHPLLFAAQWLIYLSFKSLGGGFLEYGDEVLLEVSFAAIWLAVGHQVNKQSYQQQGHDTEPAKSADLPALTHQQQQQPAQAAHQLSTATQLLVKWLLFRLLVITSTFSATYLCGQDPVLRSCWKTLVAHGLPHAASRFLQTLPGPVAALAAAVTLLELPVAFLVLAFAPVLQRLTALALLGSQLLRLALGPASLANIAAAVLCFLLLDDGLWVPGVVAAAQKLGVLRTGASTDEAQEAEHAVDTGLLSRSSSITSLAGDMFKQPHELGPSTIDAYGWAPLAAVTALVPCAGLLLSYDTQLGLLMRPSAVQLLRVLQVAVLAAMALWLGTCAWSCWQSISTAVAAGNAAAEQARADAQEAATVAEEAQRDAEKCEREAEAAAQQAGQVHAADAHAATPWHEATGEGTGQLFDVPDDAGVPTGRYVHYRRLQPPRPASVAAAMLGPVANGVHEAEHGDDAAAEDGHETDGEAEAGPSKPAAKRGRGGKAVTGKAAGAKAGKAAKDAAAESPKAASAVKKTPKQQFAAIQAAEEAAGAAAAAAASPKKSVAASRSAAARAAAAAAAAAERADEARKEAAMHRQEAAAAAAAHKQHLQRARVGLCLPIAAAAALAFALFAVFLSGAPQLLTAVSYSPAGVSWLFPGPVARFARLGHSLGLASGSSSARADFSATQRAAAAAGPGAVVVYEAYVADAGAENAAGAWQKVPLQYSLGSAQLKGRSSLWQKLKGLRGLCQMRLQGRMAAAAAVGVSQGDAAGVQPWLMVLAQKVVQGAQEMSGLLDQPVQQHDFVTISRAAYTPGTRDWRLNVERTAPAVEGQHRDSATLRTYAEVYSATPGKDGLFASVLESLARNLSGPWVLMTLLVAVLLRHLILPGGLLQECQNAMPAAAAAAH